jgi:hypothetical protein
VVTSSFGAGDYLRGVPMTRYLLLRVIVCQTALVIAQAAIVAAEEEPPKSPQTESDAEEWAVELSGSGGSRADRSQFRVKVTHDGKIEVQKGRRELGKAIQRELSVEEQQRFLSAVRKAIQSYKKSSSTGAIEDGWFISLKLTEKNEPTSIVYRKQDSLGEISMDFREIEKIILAHSGGELPK